MLVMIKKEDYGSVFGALSIDLSKDFDCILCDLFMAKLEALDYQINAVNLVYDYLFSRKQRVKINKTFSSRKSIEYGVPQGSILGPLIV